MPTALVLIISNAVGMNPRRPRPPYKGDQPTVEFQLFSVT
jgi:hypothetical protein